MKNLSMYLTIRMYCMYPVFGCNLMHCMQTTWYSSGHSKRDCLRTNQCYYSLMGHVGELLTRESRRDQYSVLTLTCTDYVVNHQLCFMQYSKFALPFCQHRKFKKKKSVYCICYCHLWFTSTRHVYVLFTFLWIYLASCNFAHLKCLLVILLVGNHSRLPFFDMTLP